MFSKVKQYSSIFSKNICLTNGFKKKLPFILLIVIKTPLVEIYMNVVYRYHSLKFVCRDSLWYKDKNNNSISNSHHLKMSKSEDNLQNNTCVFFPIVLSAVVSITRSVSPWRFRERKNQLATPVVADRQNGKEARETHALAFNVRNYCAGRDVAAGSPAWV